jgi:hypothetical protein
MPQDRVLLQSSIPRAVHCALLLHSSTTGLSVDGFVTRAVRARLEMAQKNRAELLADQANEATEQEEENDSGE